MNLRHIYPTTITKIKNLLYLIICEKLNHIEIFRNEIAKHLE